ncbi:hypothetical protein [Pandoraea sputorum]|uniref:hypothetical protein n=1 Tax=Pandoraea sputorum TaxID=93222 RepID=UPI00123F7F2C|nr:hypothetical protein [Pandoraea sputorum]VVE58459.1 hypothetical protein PSP20601_05323 [Pandoraea sputorum]
MKDFFIFPDRSHVGQISVSHGPDVHASKEGVASLRVKPGGREVAIRVAQYATLEDREKFEQRARIEAPQQRAYDVFLGPEVQETNSLIPPMAWNLKQPPMASISIEVEERAVTREEFSVMADVMRHGAPKLMHVHIGLPRCAPDEATFERIPLLPVQSSPKVVIEAFRAAGKLVTFSLDLNDSEFILDPDMCDAILVELGRKFRYLGKLEGLTVSMDTNVAREEAVGYFFKQLGRLPKLKELSLDMSASRGFGENNRLLLEAGRRIATMKSLAKLQLCLNDISDEDKQIDDIVIREFGAALQTLSSLKDLRLEFGESNCTLKGPKAIMALVSNHLGGVQKLHIRASQCETPEGHDGNIAELEWAPRAPLGLEQLTIEIDGVPHAPEDFEFIPNPDARKDLVEIFNWVGGAQNLKSLSLDISSITELGANCPLLRHGFRQLKTLTLLEKLEVRTNKNFLTDDTALEALGESLREMPWLGSLRLELDDSLCTDQGLDHLFETIANNLDQLRRVDIQARGCSKINEDAVRTSLEYHFENTNVAATVVLGHPLEETHLAY